MELSAKQFPSHFLVNWRLWAQQTYWDISLELRKMGEAEKCVQLR